MNTPDEDLQAAGNHTGASRATLFVAGRVQGVGFRWWTRSRALELGLSGYAKNLADGRVEVDGEIVTEAKKIAYRLDPTSFVARRAAAEADDAGASGQPSFTE